MTKPRKRVEDTPSYLPHMQCGATHTTSMGLHTPPHLPHMQCGTTQTIHPTCSAGPKTHHYELHNIILPHRHPHLPQRNHHQRGTRAGTIRLHLWHCKESKCQTYRIGGIADHIHMFVSLPSYLSLASFVQRVKTDSSKWLKANSHFPDFRGWGREYAGFSYSLRDKDMIVGYIMKQKEHHRKKTFAEEHRTFLTENGVSIDERYFLRDD